MAMTLSDYKDGIIVGLGGLIVAWLIFLTWFFMTVPNKDEVQDMLGTATRMSPYLADRPLISDKLNQLFTNYGKIDEKFDRILDAVRVNQLELERLIVKEEVQMEQFRKRLMRDLSPPASE